MPIQTSWLGKTTGTGKEIDSRIDFIDFCPGVQSLEIIMRPTHDSAGCIKTQMVLLD
jgi:hypothetical protein